MGKKDKAIKLYIQDPRRFSYLINAVVFSGRQVIEPDNLVELNVEELLELGEDRILESYRDVMKEAVILGDNIASYVILGIENQSDIDYTMPVRKMLYNLMTYRKQVVDIQKQSLDNHNPVQKIRKENRIKPVITFTLYWGSEKWDGATTLKEMMEPYPKELSRYIDDIDINLISIIEIEQYLKYIPDEKMRNIFELLSMKEDKERFKEALLDENRYGNIDYEEAALISAIADVKMPRKKKGGGYNMCGAVEGIKQDARNEGLIQGKKEGLSEGLKATVKVLKDIFGELQLVWEQMVKSGITEQVTFEMVAEIYKTV